MPYYVSFITGKPLGRSHTGGVLYKVFVGENKAKNKEEARKLALRNSPHTFREQFWGMGDGTGEVEVETFTENNWETSVRIDHDPEMCEGCGSVKVESDTDVVIVSEKDWGTIETENENERASNLLKIDKLDGYVSWDLIGDKKCQNCLESKRSEFEWEFSEVYLGISIVFLLVVLISSFTLL